MWLNSALLRSGQQKKTYGVDHVVLAVLMSCFLIVMSSAVMMHKPSASGEPHIDLGRAKPDKA